MPIYLGIDGGGTKTACALGDDECVLAVTKAGGSNPLRVGEETAHENLKAAVCEAVASAGVRAKDVVRTCVGMAGASAPQTRAMVRRAVGECVGGDILFAGDHLTALHAAFADGAGVIVISGTGSIAFGRNEEGQTARAGGWGHAISDEGSAHWIGRTAISRMLREYDRGQPTALQPAIFQELQITTYDELVKLANSNPPMDFALLAPVVVQAAEQGDEAARGVLIDGGRELAHHAVTVIRQLWPDERWVRLALAGSVMQHAMPVTWTFFQEVRAQRDRVSLLLKTVNPVEGALALARRSSTRV